MSHIETITLTAAADGSASAGPVVGAASLDASYADSVTLDAELTGNTGGALDVYIQREVATDVWRDWVHFAQIAAGAAAARYTVACALASESVVTTVGVGDATTATPALAAGDIACPTPGGRMRLVMDHGVGTTASALQTIHVHLAYDYR